MRGESRQLLVFMEGSYRRFIIPVYQRNYDWKKDNCQQLLNDLKDVISDNRESHFFGSIVSFTDGRECTIIDGQQRITTVSLLLLALCNLIDDKLIECNDKQLSQIIREDYLINRFKTDEEYKIKLKPVKNDMRAFSALFDKDAERVLESNITQNYMFLYEWIKESSVSAEDLFDAVSRLDVIDITVESTDDPQLIFESLNSTGLDLNEADKIRNYILMGLDYDSQEKMYDRYWNKIEINTDYAVSEFMRQYLTLKLGRWPKINNVYQEFKQFEASTHFNTESLLSDLLSYAEFYQQIANGSTGHNKVDVVLKRLSLLDMSVINPLLFALFERLKSNKISEDDFCSTLKVLESYLFRRLVCEVSTNSLNKIFATLNNDTLKIIGDERDYVEALVYLLLQKKSSGRFPMDDEFEHSVETRDFYNMSSKNRVYYFNRLVNGDSLEYMNIPELMSVQKDGLSVEHIMPKTLTKAWRDDLGVDYEKIHETWKNRIANLTLTAYNSKYSNKSFKDKLTVDNGFKDSNLPINKWISQQDKWTLDELEARNKLMVDTFIKLWPFPKTAFMPKSNSESLYFLNDEIDFTGTAIVSYTFMGTRNTVTNWKEAVESVLCQLCDLDPASMHRFILRDAPTSSYISARQDDKNSLTPIGQGLFASLRNNTSTKIRLLEDVFTHFGLDSDELCFEIKSASTEV